LEEEPSQNYLLNDFEKGSVFLVMEGRRENVRAPSENLRTPSYESCLILRYPLELLIKDFDN